MEKIMRAIEQSKQGVWAVDDDVQVIVEQPRAPEHVEAKRHVDGCGFDD